MSPCLLLFPRRRSRRISCFSLTQPSEENLAKWTFAPPSTHITSRLVDEEPARSTPKVTLIESGTLRSCRRFACASFDSSPPSSEKSAMVENSAEQRSEQSEAVPAYILFFSHY